MPKQPAHISVNRHGTYHFRIVIPLALRDAFNLQREIRRSLKTDSQRLALRRARQYAARYETAFDKVLYRMSSSDDVLTPEEVEFELSLAAAEGTNANQGCMGDWSTSDRPKEAPGPALTDVEIEALLRQREIAFLLTGAYKRPVPSEKQPTASRLLELTAPYPATQLRKVLPSILSELVKQNISTLYIAPEPAAYQLRAAASNLSLFDVWTMNWENEVALNKGKSPNTKSDEQGHAKRLTILSGNKPIGCMTADDFNLIYALIPKIKTSRGFKIELNLQSEAASILAQQGEKIISAATAEKISVRLGALHAYAYKKELTLVAPGKTEKPRLDFNPPGSQAKERSFTKADLKAIFHGYIYIGESIGSANKVFPYQFWLPLLALFTGGRLNELCQLDTDDIQYDVETGLHSIDIIDDPKGKAHSKVLKNLTSRRILPIHSELVRIGFLTFVEQAVNEKRKKLFSDGLKYSANKGWGGIATTFFTRVPSPSTTYAGYFHQVGIRQRKADGDTDDKNFHSFRHTFIDIVKNSSIEAAMLLEAFTGHAKPGETEADRYGSGIYLSRKFKILHDAKFTVDLRHITYADFEKRLGDKLADSVTQHRLQNTMI